MTRLATLAIIVVSLSAGMGIGGAHQADYAKERWTADFEEYQAYEIVRQVVFAMSDDPSGDTMRRYCGSDSERRTHRGAAWVECETRPDAMRVTIMGRFYGAEDPNSVSGAVFTMYHDGDHWNAPSPTDDDPATAVKYFRYPPVSKP